MTNVVLCIFAVAVGSQLSRLGELRYVPTSVKSLASSRPPTDDTTHLLNGTTVALTTARTATTSTLPGSLGQSTDALHALLRFRSYILV